MLAVFRDAGFEESRTLGGGEIEVRFPIATTEHFRARVEERDHVAVAASLRPFFAPASVAVIGASTRRGSIGGELFRNILAADFAGAAYPVNRTGEAVAGVRAYATIEEIPDPVDLAVICLPGEHVLEPRARRSRKGVTALCVISAGFAETGRGGRAPPGALCSRSSARTARASSARTASASPSPRSASTRPSPRGRCRRQDRLLVAERRARPRAAREGAERGLGFSSFVSIGNKADVSSNDLLEWWEDDEDTDVVLLYLESFGNPRKFAPRRAARRAPQADPRDQGRDVAAPARARRARTPPRSPAPTRRSTRSSARRACCARATLEELVDVATLLSSQPLPAGRRVAVLTNAGGLGILCADACDAAGLELPELGAETRDALAAVLPERGEPREPGRPARLGDRRDLRAGAPARARAIRASTP